MKIIQKLIVVQYIFFDCLKTFFADDMFDAAGISCCGVGRNSEDILQKTAEDAVALIDCLRLLPSFPGQQNQIVFIHRNITGRAQDAHGAADAGFGKRQFVCNVDGANRSVFLFQHQNGFQIVFTGFLYLQGSISPFQSLYNQ